MHKVDNTIYDVYKSGLDRVAGLGVLNPTGDFLLLEAITTDVMYGGSLKTAGGSNPADAVAYVIKARGPEAPLTFKVGLHCHNQSASGVSLSVGADGKNTGSYLLCKARDVDCVWDPRKLASAISLSG